MTKHFFKYSLLQLLSFTILCNIYAKPTDSLETKKSIYLFELNEDIEPAATRKVKKAIAEAEYINAKYIVISMNTYGGLVADADEIRSALLETKIPSIVYIQNNAASAGALISIACDSIYMKEGATIGAAAVVYENGEMAPEKYQSYMRNKMRATAEATHRNPDIAEGMVDPKVSIEGITNENEIITFSVNEAIKNNYCIAKAKDVDDVLTIAQLSAYKKVYYSESISDKIISFFVNPAVASVLLMIIIAGIYFELQSPGIGFPIMASVIAALLYFTPHYMEGLAENWEIFIFLIGVVLLAAEIFVIPGFGIAGISGIIAIVGGLTLSLIRNVDGFEFGFVSQSEIMVSVLTISGLMIVLIMVIFFGGEKIMSAMFATGGLGLAATQKKEDGFIISEIDKLNTFVGKIGNAETDLRPSGKISIENEWLDAQSDGVFLSKGSTIKVLTVSGAYLIVEQHNEQE